jgi:hypothetical protein
MKKMYIQPNVETAEVLATSMLLDASPAGSGITINDPTNPANQIPGE